MSKIIVTGGCGYIGAHTTIALIEQGYQVIIFDNLSNASKDSISRIEKITGTRPELLVVDLKDQNKTTAAFEVHKDASAVIHFAAYKAVKESVEQPLSYYENNLFSLINTLVAQQKFGIKNFIFSSSATVYGAPESCPVTEDSPTFPSRQSGIALVEVEEMLKSSGIPMTILRMGGLVGYNRRPGRFLAGRKNLIHANAPVNLVHLDDCIHVIWEIIQQDRWGEVFNVCADDHPKRKEFYTFAATKMGLPVPEFSLDQTEGGKCVSNAKLKESLSFSFQYADPYQMVN